MSMDKGSGAEPSLERQCIAVMLKNLHSNPVGNQELQELVLFSLPETVSSGSKRKSKLRIDKSLNRSTWISWLI